MSEKQKKKMTEQQRQMYVTRLLEIMIDHVGNSQAIGMGELYEQVFGQPYNHRINDTRMLRVLVTELRRAGRPICSNGNGYYIASAGSELKDYCANLRAQGLRKLMMEAKIRKVSLAEILGQVRLDMEKIEFEK